MGFCLAGHRNWHCEVSVAEESRFDWDIVQGSKQVTDLYLLALAVKNGGRLVTFDRRIRWGAVRGAEAGRVEILSVENKVIAYPVPELIGWKGTR